jgi:hypothetical protein
MSERKCKPGGCSAIGCEGGRYCFTPDGKRREVSKEERARLIEAIESAREGLRKIGASDE